MTTSPVYGLTALGLVNALGNNKNQVLENLLQGESPGMISEAGWIPGVEVLTAQVQGTLASIDHCENNNDEQEQQLHQSRNNQLLLSALKQIEQPVAQAIKRYGRDRVGIVIGSSTSGIAEGERALACETAPTEYHYRQQEIGAPALFLAQQLNIESIAYTVSTACSSSTKAFASARNLLMMNICDAVIVGGADSLCKLTVNGFTALQSVSPSRCKPFSKNRDGITIGEGAALFLMEKEPAAINLLGVGESADAHHISAPHPEGDGAAAAMQAALDDAGLQASDINYLNLHGTATIKNDEMESKAVNRVLGNHVACSSTKPLIGHTLGAAGASEIALCWLLLSQPSPTAMLPSQVWDGELDPELADIDLLTQDRTFEFDGPHRMMSNSFAFGGSNASIIIGGA